MIDKLEKANLQDLMYAKALGIDNKEVDKYSLYQMKNELHHKAFEMRRLNRTISQEEADILNTKLNEIIDELCECDYDYDPMIDYIVDFDSFVVNNSYYNKFCW